MNHNRFLKMVLLTCFAMGSIHLGAAPAEAASKEERIKAALLVNIIKFVKWPALGSKLKVCGAASNGLNQTLAKKLKGKKIKSKAVMYKTVSSSGSSGCHVAVFDGKNVPSALHSKPILTVGKGGIISFSNSGGKIQFSVNRSRAKRNKLSISGQLLKLAKSVK